MYHYTYNRTKPKYHYKELEIPKKKKEKSQIWQKSFHVCFSDDSIYGAAFTRLPDLAHRGHVTIHF